MAAQANTTKHLGPFLGLLVFVGLSVLVAPGCQVTTGPGSVSSSMPAANAADPEAGADASSMTSADPQNGAPDAGGGACPTIRPRSCPAQGAACTQVGANCSYGDYCCTCGDQMKQWFCAQTDATDPCPKDPPPAGSRCNLDTVGCRYCTPEGLKTAACSNQQIIYYAPQCEATIAPPPPPAPEAGSGGPPPDAGMTGVDPAADM
jgi:hypothetical protein